MFNNIPIMILLTNKNTALIYLVTVCEQKTNNNSVWREGAPNINSSTVVFIFGVDPLSSTLFSTNYDKELLIHRINLICPVDIALLVSIIQFTYPLDNDLSSG